MFKKNGSHFLGVSNRRSKVNYLPYSYRKYKGKNRSLKGHVGDSFSYVSDSGHDLVVVL